MLDEKFGRNYSARARCDALIIYALFCTPPDPNYFHRRASPTLIVVASKRAARRNISFRRRLPGASGQFKQLRCLAVQKGRDWNSYEIRLLKVSASHSRSERSFACSLNF